MIGLKTQNRIWLKALMDLYPNQVEAYTPKHDYTLILTWGTDLKAPPQNTPVLDLTTKLTFPCRKAELDNLIYQYETVNYENDAFIWDGKHRQLIDKETHEPIPLTQKEAELIQFLTQSENHQASREILLQQVWHYTSDAETHTLESHLYTLRQKLGHKADQFIQSDKNDCRLV